MFSPNTDLNEGHEAAAFLSAYTITNHTAWTVHHTMTFTS